MSYQLLVNQRYYSLIANQHQLSATAKRNTANTTNKITRDQLCLGDVTQDLMNKK